MTPERPQKAFNPWLIALVVMIATFMEVLDTSVANVALPHIAGNLSSTVDEATWVLTSYLVANAVVLPLGGYFGMLFGRKRFYMTCVLLFTVSSLLCGLAPSLPWLIFFRIMQGLGGGALQPTSQAILVENFPHEKRGAAMALYGMGVVLAPIVGPVLGGWITDNYSWHWIFLINVPVGALSLFLTYRMVHDPPTLKRASIKEGFQVDYLGIGILTLGLAALEIVLDEGQRRDWFASNLIVVCAVLAVVCLVGVVFYLLKKDHPILDLRLLKDRNFAVSTVMLFVLGFVLYGSLAVLPIFLQTLLGYTASLSGWILSPGGVVILFMMPLVARLLKFVDTRKLIAFGFMTCGAGLLWMSAFNLQVPFQTAMMSRMLQSLGLAFLFIPMNVTAFQNVPMDKTSYATGMLNLVRNIGGSTGIALVSTILSRRGQVHQANLVGNLHPGSLQYQGFLQNAQHVLVAKGSSLPDAAHQAQGMAYGTLLRQANMMAFSDTFWIMGVLCFVLLPLLLLMRKTHAGQKPVVMDH
ncbi:DHA2 family efflux MFS transporter permease subunit [Mesoterricola sediminis]|uniref:EmrB/QacA family drug resistance transporter n=1 Tax=Mesoterricola sediminis TaxID=2927980 RepID=A0AA48KE27_9BACT|nr:DHA2 family efflux MFS transporter permease subunit [Mesoterricola sediminis]BDU76927.1 EmrB/QacA family drug resistance transporter [Mesoterricola sediminis]